MNSITTLVSTFTLILALSISSHAQEGTLDPTFGSNGAFLFSAGDHDDYSYALTVLPDDRMVLIGHSESITGTSADVTAVRLLPDGGFDNSFSGDGKVFFDFHQLYNNGLAVEQYPDGKLLVVGAVGLLGNSEVGAFAMRLNENGTPDDTFGDEGVVEYQVGEWRDVLFDAALLGDGSILLAGYSYGPDGNFGSVTKLLPGGQVDESFAVDGHYFFQLPGSLTTVVNAIAVQTDDKIVMAGYTGGTLNRRAFVGRLNADGTADAGFGGTTGGVVLYSALDASTSTAEDLVLRPDDRILVAGALLAGTPRMLLFQMTADGLTDDSFGTEGEVVPDIGTPTSAQMNALALRTDGSVVAVGTSFTGEYGRCVLLRFSADGTQDMNFGDDGMALYDHLPSSSEEGWGVGLQSGGNAVVLANIVGMGDVAVLRYAMAPVIGIGEHVKGRSNCWMNGNALRFRMDPALASTKAVDIMDLSGRTVLSTSIALNDGEGRVQLADLTPGIYVAGLRINGERLGCRFQVLPQ